MRKYSAMEKCRAVLSIWAEKRKASEVARELGVGTGLLCQWQETAMEGMLQVLEPKWQEESRCPALLPKLKKLLDRKVGEREGRLPRLERRLARLTRAESKGLAEAGKAPA